ncbi:MAG: hypothetical protein ACLTAO_03865 [Christensenellales bacterium]
MKKLISIILCTIMMAPTAMVFADSADSEDGGLGDLAISAVADVNREADSTILRAALMSSRMSCLALHADGWASQADITDLWGPVYGYINTFNDYSKQPINDDGALSIPADYVRKVFEDMYGEKYDELPVVSRMYSSVIVYDEKNDAYNISPADGEGIYAVLSDIRLTGDDVSAAKGSVVMTYTIKSEYENDAELRTVSIYLGASDVSASGLMPVRAEVTELNAAN